MLRRGTAGSKLRWDFLHLLFEKPQNDNCSNWSSKYPNTTRARRENLRPLIWQTGAMVATNAATYPRLILPSDGPTTASDRPNLKPPSRAAARAVPILSVLLVGALAGGGYLWHTATAWQANAGAWETQARRQGAEVVDLTEQLDAANSQLASLQGQLGTATTRITSLADEKAQLGDEAAIWQQYLDEQAEHLEYQSRISAAAATAADSLERCRLAQTQLIRVLRSAEDYDAYEVREFSDGVDRLCNLAATAAQDLRVELPVTGGAWLDDETLQVPTPRRSQPTVVPERNSGFDSSTLDDGASGGSGDSAGLIESTDAANPTDGFGEN